MKKKISNNNVANFILFIGKGKKIYILAPISNKSTIPCKKYLLRCLSSDATELQKHQFIRLSHVERPLNGVKNILREKDCISFKTFSFMLFPILAISYPSV